MINIGVFTPYGDDHSRNIQFCGDADVRFIIHSTDDAARERELDQF